MKKTPEIEFHCVRRYDGKTVIHKATSLGEFLSFREKVEAEIANTDSKIGFSSYTVVYPKASEIYYDPKRLVNKIVDRTVESVRLGLYKGE